MASSVDFYAAGCVAVCASLIVSGTTLSWTCLYSKTLPTSPCTQWSYTLSVNLEGTLRRLCQRPSRRVVPEDDHKASPVSLSEVLQVKAYMLLYIQTIPRNAGINSVTSRLNKSLTAWMRAGPQLQTRPYPKLTPKHVPGPSKYQDTRLQQLQNPRRSR